MQTRTMVQKYAKARNKYRPERIRLLLIAESPPSSGGFFYFDKTIGKDHLFRETMKALRLWHENKRMTKGIDKSPLHDPELAREQFFGIPEPTSEVKCIELLEGFFETLKEFNPTIAEGYRGELTEFVEEHNMSYVVSSDCKLHLSIQGLLVSQFARLCNALASNAHINQSLQQLEDTVSRLKEGSHEERICIGIATNLLEGIARDKTINNQDTLGRAIDGCDVFPHSAVRDCVKSFYKFASDYPNIRHSGTAASKLRELKKDDALLAVSFAVAFGSYIFDNDSSNAILKGDL